MHADPLVHHQVARPGPALSYRLCDRHAVDPHTSLFVDDAEANTSAAERLAFGSVLFSSPSQLRKELQARGVVTTTP